MQQMVLYCKNLLFYQHVSGNIMPIIRSSRVLYSIPQTGHITYSSTPDQKPVNQNTKYRRQQPPV